MAKTVAQDLVVYYRRPGGQSQFSALLEPEARSERIQRGLSYVRAHLCKATSVEQLAKAAGLSPRQFGRVFLEETGQTPSKAIEGCELKRLKPGSRTATNQSKRSLRE